MTVSEGYQLDFFKDSNISRLESIIEKNKTSQDKVRRKLFAENNKSCKLIDELSLRLEIIEKGICRGDENAN